MADLPSVRITQALPFVNTGCDYAGPILLKDAKVRKPRISKGYICLFVCMVTSAIHLELVTDLTTETFLAALRRFISLRGKCSKIYSDNGTNFIGAKRSLNEMQELLSSQRHRDIVTSTLADDGIQAGEWESAVRCQNASAPSHRQLNAYLRTNAHLASSNQRSDKFTPLMLHI